MPRRLLGLAVFAGALVVWEAWARLESSFLVPPASVVAERAWEVWPTHEFLSTVAASLERLAIGFAIGAGAGVAVGLALGASRGARRLFEPLVELARALPPVALVPLAIVALGVGDGMRIAIIAFGVFFPVLLGTVDGVRAVSPETRDTAALLRLGAGERLARVYLPAALPSIVAGMRVAIPIGLVLVVISELSGEGDGLGRYILLQQSLFNVPEMYAGILFLGLLGYVLNTAFVLAERRLLAWHRGAIGAAPR